jgi:hypothetical protein
MATSSVFYASVKNFEFLLVWKIDLNSLFCSGSKLLPPLAPNGDYAVLRFMVAEDTLV